MTAHPVVAGPPAARGSPFGALPWRAAMRWGLSLLAGLAFAGGISAASWFALRDAPGRGPGPVELTIPAGTYERIRSGAALSPIPSTLELVQGDILIVRNADSVPHQIGPFSVPPGGVASIPLTRASSQSFVCSFHPAGVIGLNVKAPSNPWAIVWPTVLLGVPFGIAFGALAAVMRRIDWDGGQDAAPSS